VPIRKFVHVIELDQQRQTCQLEVLPCGRSKPKITLFAPQWRVKSLESHLVRAAGFACRCVNVVAPSEFRGRLKWAVTEPALVAKALAGYHTVNNIIGPP
jgi:hypothetical protein